MNRFPGILGGALPFLATAIMFATYKAFTAGAPAALAIMVLPTWGALAAGIAAGLLFYGAAAYVLRRMQRKTLHDQSPDQVPPALARAPQVTPSPDTPQQQQPPPAKTNTSTRFTDMVTRQREAEQNLER